MGWDLQGYRAALATDLKVTVGTEMSIAEMNRAVERAVNDLSRYFPWEKVHEETLSFTVTDEAVTLPATTNLTAIVSAQSIDVAAGGLLTIAGQPDVARPLTITITDADNSTYQAAFIIRGVDADGNYQEETLYYARGYSKTLVGKQEFKYVYEVELDQDYGSHAGDTASVGYGLFTTNAWSRLAYRPIRPETETVTNSGGTITYTRGTDYLMDYTNGRIKPIAGGSMTTAQSILVDYTKSRLGINISALLPVVTKITKVQYPADVYPQQFVSFNIVGDFMYVASKVAGQSQEELVDSEHLAIWYERLHMPPGEAAPGSYPSVLDEVVAIGAGGYVLLTEAQQYEQAAGTALTSLGSALTNAIKYLNNNLVSSVQADAAGTLYGITGDAASLRTAISAVLDKSSTYLTHVSTPPSAHDYLIDGDDKIDAVNVGARVAENYADYARSSLEIFAGLVGEATTRLANLRTYIDQSGGYTQIANGFINEAQMRAEAVNGNLVLADRFRTEAINRLNEFHAILRNKAESRRRTSSIPTRQPA